MLKLRDLRKRKGITQKELAAFLNVKPHTISRYENEELKLSQEKIIKLSLALEVTPNELLGFEEAYKKHVDYLMGLKKSKSSS